MPGWSILTPILTAPASDSSLAAPVRSSRASTSTSTPPLSSSPQAVSVEAARTSPTAPSRVFVVSRILFLSSSELVQPPNGADSVLQDLAEEVLGPVTARVGEELVGGVL